MLPIRSRIAVPGDPMSAITFADFEATHRARGCDEVVSRSWEPGTVVDTHTHPFAAEALMVAGEMWLTCAGQTRHLHPGDTFTLARDEPHAERYGSAGATYWVARRA
jgi:quercetin dioxygenase-like cupin family protein